MFDERFFYFPYNVIQRIFHKCLIVWDCTKRTASIWYKHSLVINMVCFYCKTASNNRKRKLKIHNDNKKQDYLYSFKQDGAWIDMFILFNTYRFLMAAKKGTVWMCSGTVVFSWYSLVLVKQGEKCFVIEDFNLVISYQ